MPHSDLRSKIIRLAAANPDLRADLLPLLGTTDAPSRVAASQNPGFQIVWEPERHTIVPVITGIPRPPNYGPWSRPVPHVVEFTIVQGGERIKTQPSDNYIQSGHVPGTEFWKVAIRMGGKTYQIKRTWPVKQLEAAKEWCSKVLSGEVKVSGMPPIVIAP